MEPSLTVLSLQNLELPIPLHYQQRVSTREIGLRFQQPVHGTPP